MPHVIPYQGSKRLLAPAILGVLREQLAGQRVRRLYEPFAGSAALTLAAAHANLADAFVVSGVGLMIAALTLDDRARR